MHTETLARSETRPGVRHLLTAIAARLRAAIRARRVPHADELSPHLRRDIGLPPEVHRPTHAPPRVF